MERPTSSLSYKGSVSDAVTAAVTHKKLFVVYISGDDDSSKKMEQSTLVDQRVVESVSKLCIFLHLNEGTVDAFQFSAIYPQKSIPSISVVGYNGVMIFQHEGFISTEIFLESVEKAWESMKLQEKTAAILTAALASKKLESSSNILSSSEKGDSSIVDTPSTSGGTLDKDEEIDVKNSSPDAIVEDERSSSTAIAGDSIQVRAANNSNGSGVASTVLEAINSSDRNLASATTISTETHFANSNSERVHKSSEIVTEMEGNGEKATNCSASLQSSAKSDRGSPIAPNSVKLTDVHLNIRLPSGARLQLRSPLTDTLQSVKNYVDENAACNLGAYDLAIPYPRKIFMDQDMSLPLSELGFASREALIVVPHRHAAVVQRSRPAAYHPSGESEAHPGANEGGYFAFLRRMLSFINPFSYLGGASHSAPEPAPSPVQQQGPAFQGNPSGAERSYRPYASNKGTPQAGSSSSTTQSRAPARAGSNIHTLRDVEGDDPSNDRNLFWNGNSTEFGGDDKN